MSTMPSVSRRRLTTSLGVGVDVDRTINAVLEVASGPTAIEAMETSASPRATPTTPTMPGRSSLRTTNIDAAGGISTLFAAPLPIRGYRRLRLAQNRAIPGGG